MAYHNLFRGTIISTVAAFLISLVLFYLIIYGLNSITSVIPLSLMYILFALAILAYLEYRKLPLPYRNTFEISLPIGLAIVFIGLLLLTFGFFEGAYLVVIGYLSEPIGGIAPFKYYMMFDRNLGLITYILGAIYVLTLPLLAFGLGIVPLLADVLKFVCFIQIYRVVSNSKFDIEELRIKKTD